MNFMKLICENAVTEHSVTFYVDYLCVSTKHLTRLTKETFKQTPHEMICKEIIYHALDMLDNYEISIRQISDRKSTRLNSSHRGSSRMPSSA